ncbi:glycosyltransferase [Algoriphagus sp.]|uniref:glycosyltransferase n=1 Tax=Algoriphagus sp. TaxID=1872435 RepID=UPI0027171FA7|nr:glycosyltransferase [Algoriphagus sp.]MDO8965699.1 glycosyltransferase [Algoriphagus sp.]MDP3202392.1 glycosyltransferase [Algoriphagus sp.]
MVGNKINFHFFNTLCSKKTHEVLFKQYNVTSGNAAQNFFGLIAEGLKNNSNTTVFVNSVLPINHYDQKKIFWKLSNELENDIHYNYIPIVNLPILNNFITSFFIFFQILFKNYYSESKDIIIVDFLRFSINLPVILACKLRGIKTLVIVTDLPGEGILQTSFKTKIRNLFIFLLYYDFYVCVTNELNRVVNKKNRPFLIIESFANVKFNKLENSIEDKFSEKVIIYAGGLYERYGIKMLIEGFKMIHDPNVRLWLFGVGPFTDEIIKYSKIDNRIEYKGIIPNEELIGILSKATALINPRPSHEKYTKYSFPSKNLEYMSIGTPLITTKLYGIPGDHYPYIYLIEDESKFGIFTTLQSILEKNKEELHQFGLRCKLFTMREKNNIVQTNKIIKMINGSF